MSLFRKVDNSMIFICLTPNLPIGGEHLKIIELGNPIDLHDSKGIIPKLLDEGVVATIPLRALIPRGSKNFLVAGRCISSDRMANSALRVHASCMGMVQAAGAAAALAIHQKTTPINMPIKDIKEMLLDYGAIVPV
jgi:hypothetical protein